MVKVPKRKSKRQTLHQKYKVEKKIRQHKAKQRRDSRKNPGKGKVKKDPGIPNLHPLKDEMLAKIERQKEKLAEEQVRQKEARKQQQASKRAGLAAMLTENAQREKAFEAKQKKEEREKEREQGQRQAGSVYGVKDGSKKAYYREFKKILEMGDIILEVLDARDPLGCRCPEIEQRILAKDPNKKIILVLNKIDLIPKENVEQWLKYLRNDYPTIAFKCTTQSQRQHLGHKRSSVADASHNMLESSECLGADTLVQLLKNYCRNKDIKTAISVGIIGFPNVGKSSLINSLKRAKAVGVGATPGFTKSVQEIQLDKNIKLLDCPGIVWGTSKSDNDIILRNAVKVERIADAVEPVETILKRCRAEQLLQTYKIPTYGNVTEFLIHIAQKRGKLIKGGKADLQAAARSVLQDWNSGRIKFFTTPPAVKKGVHLEAAVVSNWSAEFDLESVIKDEQRSVLGALKPTEPGAELMAMEAGSAEEMALDLDSMEADDTEEAAEQDDADEGSDDDESGSDEEDGDEASDDAAAMEDEDVPAAAMAGALAGPAAAATASKNKKSVAGAVSTAGAQKQKMADAADAFNPQTNRDLKRQQKRARKSKQKSAGSAVSGDDSYSFATDFVSDEEDGMEDA